MIGCPVPVTGLLGEQPCGKGLGTTRGGDPTLMCREHWARVPEHLQIRVWRTWRQLKREKLRSEFPAEYQQAELAYRTARVKAIDAAMAAGGLS